METILVIGAGLVGSVLSMFLAKRGYRVEVYERGPDLRRASLSSGRSINLTLCDRGLRVLDILGVGTAVRDVSVPAYGRLIHDDRGELTFQPYGNSGEAIYSIARSDLNSTLLEYAESNFDITFHFNRKCVAIDLASATVEFEEPATVARTRIKADRIMGADGAYSVVRKQMQKSQRLNYFQEYWHQGYKELRVPAQLNHGWATEKNVLHIWPRGHYMLIGFPNTDGSFTCSLHIPFEGDLSFNSIKTQEDLLRFFCDAFPDVISHMPDLVKDYFANPPNSMVTIKCSPWSYQDKAVLVGDACHSIYPSYGQGANAGFEDCAFLYECLESHPSDWKAVFAEYQRLRKPNTDAIADLCVEHFVELRDLVGDPRFLLRKEVERKINQLYPEKYKDLYSMITFTCMPYIEALRIDREQRAIVDRIMSVEGIEQKIFSAEVDRLIEELMASRQSQFDWLEDKSDSTAAISTVR